MQCSSDTLGRISILTFAKITLLPGHLQGQRSLMLALEAAQPGLVGRRHSGLILFLVRGHELCARVELEVNVRAKSPALEMDAFLSP